MKSRIAHALKRTMLLVLPMLLWGCTTAAPSTTAALADLPAFIGDFVRQMLAAVLL